MGLATVAGAAAAVLASCFAGGPSSHHVPPAAATHSSVQAMPVRTPREKFMKVDPVGPAARCQANWNRESIAATLVHDRILLSAIDSRPPPAGGPHSVLVQ